MPERRNRRVPTGPSTAGTAGSSAKRRPLVASPTDTLRALAIVLVPLASRGLIARRAALVRLVGRLGLDRRLVRELQRLRRRYGGGPLMLRLPGRTLALVLELDDARRVLQATPSPFTPATLEKRAALSKFQPHGVLVSSGERRAERRRANEWLLDADAPVHRLAAPMVPRIHEEADRLLAVADERGVLVWDDFVSVWWRMVRRLVFGDGARDDHALTDALSRLRRGANWAYFSPRQRRLRRAFDHRLRARVERAEEGSLAFPAASLPPEVDGPQQLPQWLFAFDPAAMATLRALALLAVDRQSQLRHTGGTPAAGPPDERLITASVLESLRLWPTTPAILRDGLEPTAWGSGDLPRGIGLVIVTPLFHRDDERLEVADRFAPQLWAEDADQRSFLPFSAGPGVCPGRNLVLFVSGVFLARLTAHRHLALLRPRLDPERLPATLDPYGLVFRTIARSGAP